MSLYVFLGLMVLASWFDWKTMKIPNSLIVLGLFTGLGVSYGVGGWTALAHSLYSLVFISVLFITIWALSTSISFKLLGAGDVKLFMVMSTFLGVDKSFELILYSIIVGGVILAIQLKPKRIMEIFSEFFHFIVFLIPGRSSEQLKRRTFAPILLVTIIADYFHLFDVLLP